MDDGVARIKKRWLRLSEEQPIPRDSFRQGYVSGLAWAMNVIGEESGAGAGRGVHPASADRRSDAGSESGVREGRAPDYGLEAQRAAEAHLAACQESFWDYEADEPEPKESPASAPFCNCDTCIVREVLWAAWPIVVRYAAAELPYKKALEEIQRLPGQTLVTQQIVSEALADGAGAEAEDQDQRRSDDREHHILEGQVHLASVPPPPDE